MSYQDQERLWLTQGNKSSKDVHHLLDPHALYGFFSNANSERPHHRRARSAMARTHSHHDYMYKQNRGHPPGYETPDFQIGNPKNPTPTPATSRPASSRSSYSSLRSVKKNLSSPSALYLGSQRGRCKSAPTKPPPYIPRRLQTSKSRSGSALYSGRGAPQRSWELRTNSALSHRSLLSLEETQKRQKERCRSAPMPYDFSRVELVTEIPQNGTDYERLHAMTKPLACMPNIVQNAVTHNGLRHCCSAYDTRTKITPDTRQQFWPVPRTSVYRRGFVPQYFSFVKPACLTGDATPTITFSHPPDRNQQDTLPVEEDFDETVLFEDNFFFPGTLTEQSISDRFDPSDDDADVMDDIVNEYLQNGIVSDPDDCDDVLLLPSGPITAREESELPTAEDEESEIDVHILSEVSPEPEEPIVEEEQDILGSQEDIPVVQEHQDARGTQEDLSIVQEHQDVRGTQEDLPVVQEHQNVIGTQAETTAEDPSPAEVEDPELTTETPEEESVPQEPEQVLEEKLPGELPPNAPSSVPNPQPSRVTFVDSIKVTSYKPPDPKETKTEPVKPILKQPKLPTPVMAEKSVTDVVHPSKPKPRPLVERREADLRPQVKPGIILKPEPPKVKEEKKELVEEPKPLEEKLPEPEFIPAPGAYRMYQPMSLGQHELGKARNKKKSSPMPLPNTGLSGYHQMLPESSSVINTIREDEKRKREGIKPWLQGRLALSKQTSRFELPMDVKVLESMTAMEYLTKYCIISTRRKALYKHVFQKVDKDRDGVISFRELDKGLRDIHVDSIDANQVRSIREMIGADDKTKFNMKQFSAIAAFSERILISNFVTEETKSINNKKEIIEEADFCSLKWKLDGYNVNPTVRKILESL